MKKWLFIFLLFSGLGVAAQQDAAYEKFLSTTNEIAFKDSLLIDSIYIAIEPMDTFTVKKWFSNALSILNNNRLKKR
ncbi:MAG TPA: hypothetical protein PLG88_02070, partial [Chitinophagaceae bacterium]|nr:hypothetical protein [Chitinophagaceae bacterium]